MPYVQMPSDGIPRNREACKPTPERLFVDDTKGEVMEYKILGINDDQDWCDLCGKTRLKRVVWLESEEGEILAVGTDCAGKLLYGRKSAKNTKMAKDEASAIQAAKDWLEKGHDLQAVAAGIRDRYGYMTDVRNGKVRISMRSGIVEI